MVNTGLKMMVNLNKKFKILTKQKGRSKQITPKRSENIGANECVLTNIFNFNKLSYF